jgi:hypothetical protein
LLAVVLGASGARAETYTYRVEGVFTQDSTTTPGLAGDSFVLRVRVDAETPGTPSLGGFLFSGGVGDVAIEGVPFRSGLPAFVSHDCCGDGTLQVGVDLGESDFFVPFFTDLELPEPATLTPPWILAAQEQIGFADEGADGVPARSGTASLVSAIVVDQENPPGGNDTAPQGIGCFDENTGEPEDCESFALQSAQTFTVGVEGMLSFVQTPVSNLSGAGGGEPFLLEILELDGDAPGSGVGSVLGSASLPASALLAQLAMLSESALWPSFDVRPLGIRVTPGDRLAFSVRTEDVGGYETWLELGPESYGGGDGFRRNTQQGSWADAPGTDFLFRTFVPEPDGRLLAPAVGAALLALRARRPGSRRSSLAQRVDSEPDEHAAG